METTKDNQSKIHKEGFTQGLNFGYLDFRIIRAKFPEIESEILLPNDLLEELVEGFRNGLKMRERLN